MTVADQHGERAAGTAELLEVLGRLLRTTRAAGHRHQAGYGLSGTPFSILKTLADADARAGDLAQRLQVAPSVVSRAVVPLEQAGLVQRVNDPSDARAARLTLTSAGHRRLEAARRDFADRFAPLLDHWDTADVRTLARLMARLEQTLGENADLGAPGARTAS